ncbi:MAG TPA: TonB-dependent receptor, partial [Vicinamibacteria bacterium]
LSEPHSISLRGLYTRSSEDFTRISQGPNYNFGTPNNQISSLDFIERGLFLGVLSGNHRFTPAGGFQVDWLGSYSETMRDEPDRRENIYEANAEGQLALSTRNTLPLSRIFGDMNEYDRSAAAHLSKPIPFLGGRESKLKLGGAYRYRNRLSSFRRLGFALGPPGRNALDRTLSPEELLTAENIKAGYFELVEDTRQNDTYRAHQELWASYGMVTVPVLARLDVLAGARYENSDQSVEAKSPFVTSVEPTNVLLKDEDWLPAVNATYRVNDRMNVRGGFSITVSRPELREMSPFDMYDYETGFSEVGNPSIQSTTIENYDARWEFFPGSRELLAVSLFRKMLAQPIENVVEGSSGGYILSPRNGKDGRLYGIELETRVAFRRVWDALDTALPMPASSSALDSWAFNVNYSHVESSVKVRTSTDAGGAPIYREGPLQGQSAYALNAGVFYGDASRQGALMVSQFGERLAQVGAGAYPSSLPDIYEHPPTSLDFTLSQKLGPGVGLKFSAENLLNDPTEFRQLGLITRRFNTGRVFSLSFNWKS